MKEHILYTLTLIAVMLTSSPKASADSPPSLSWENRKVILSGMPCVATTSQFLYPYSPNPYPNGIPIGTIEEGKMVSAFSDEVFMNGEPGQRPWVAIWSPALAKSGWASVRSFQQPNIPDEYWLRPARDTDFTEATFTPLQLEMHQNPAWSEHKLFLDEVTGGTFYPSAKLEITSPRHGNFVLSAVLELYSTQGQSKFPVGPQPTRSRPRIDSTSKQTVGIYSPVPMAGLSEGNWEVRAVFFIDLAGPSGTADEMWDESQDQLIRRVHMGTVQVLGSRPVHNYGVTATTGGTATVDNPTAKEGDAVTWAAAAAAGYRFVRFKDQSSGWTTTENPLRVAGMSASVTMQAEFELKPIQLALLVPGGGGSISIDPGPHTMGQELMATAHPNSIDDIFVRWEGLASGSQNPVPVTVPGEDTELIAVFRHRQSGELKFTPLLATGGRIVNAAAFTTEALPITVDVQAETGYFLESLEVNGARKHVLELLTDYNPLVDSGLSLRISGDTTVRPVFRPTPLNPVIEFGPQRPGMVLRLLALDGLNYSLQGGSDLKTWSDETPIFGGVGTAAFRDETPGIRRFYRAAESTPRTLDVHDSFAARPIAPLWTSTGGVIRWAPGTVILAAGQSLARQVVAIENSHYLLATITGTGAITGTVQLTFGNLAVPIGITPASISLAGASVGTSTQGALSFLVIPPRTPLDTHCRLRVFAGENLVAETELAAKDAWDAVHSFELKLSATSGSWVLTAARIINW